jgi:hypothetical protein
MAISHHVADFMKGIDSLVFHEVKGVAGVESARTMSEKIVF